jgi:site-specific DNA-methyltransferase (adenine-specific)
MTMTATKSIDTFINRVIHGDCIEVLKTMPPESVDMVITDPPYLVNYHSSDGRTYPNDDPRTATWLKPAFAEVYRVLKSDRFSVCFYGFPHAEKFITAWKAAGFWPLDILVWHKEYPSSERFVGRYHEQAYLLAKGHPRKPHTRLPSVLAEWKYTGNKLHPTQKPLQALLPLVMSFSNPGDIILDPFAGSGTTAVAATFLNRRYVAIELDQTYCAIAQKRLSATHQRTAHASRRT